MQIEEERFAEAVRRSGFKADVRTWFRPPYVGGTASDYVAAAMVDPRVREAHAMNAGRPGDAVVCVVPRDGEDAQAVLDAACDRLTAVRTIGVSLSVVAPVANGRIVPEPPPPERMSWLVRFAWRVTRAWRRMRRKGV